MIDLGGKHIFIAGGGRGIGRETAIRAARAGAIVSVNYVRNADAARATVSAIENAGGTAVAIAGDMAADGAAEAAVQSAVGTLGPLFGVVISAGIFEPSPIADMTPAFWDRTMDINLRSTYLVVRAVVPHLRANVLDDTHETRGSVVIYSSTAGQRGSDVYSAYAVSKGGQILFARSMARELASDRIRVNCVAPGWTETDMATDTINALGRADIVAGIPLGRIGRPEDPANAACFLLSDLSQFITGSTITVDGGFDMRG